ncbi:hypothetical protein B0H13DRAFT_1891192 [Mycena leptocephala]|nr:hypothetical protein B0H13DRAFT_1891192 [Mycena leptocephala]
MTVPLHGKCDFTCEKSTGEFMQSMRAPSGITCMRAYLREPFFVVPAQDHRAGTRKGKQSREPFFVVPAHETIEQKSEEKAVERTVIRRSCTQDIEQKLGRERSGENRSSSFLHIRPLSKNSEEKAAERTFFVVPAHGTIEQKLGRKPLLRQDRCSRERARQAKDEITDSDQIVRAHQDQKRWDQADQKCRLMPQMRRAQKPIEYGPRTPLRGFKEAHTIANFHRPLDTDTNENSICNHAWVHSLGQSSLAEIKKRTWL